MDLSQAFNEDASFGIFSDLQPVCAGISWPSSCKRRNFTTDCGRGVPCTILPRVGSGSCVTSGCSATNFTRILVEQIRYLFHVDLQEADGDSKLPFVWILLDVIKNLIDCSWDQPILELRWLLCVRHISLRFAPKYRMSLA